MKKILLFLFAFFSFSQLLAQNLEFSQVKLVSTIETVPTDKVWKVTNVMPSTTAYNGSVDIKVNGNTVRVKSRDYMSNAQSGGHNTSMSSWTILSGAYWLPSGTTLSADANCEFISVIEFSTQ